VTLYCTNQSHFKATETYQVYREYAEAIDTNVLGQKRTTGQLREYETPKIIGLDDRCSEIPIDSRMRQRLIDIVGR